MEEIQCKLHEMEKNNKGLRVMFNEVLHGNTKLQKHKKEQEAKYTELQSKLQEKDQETQWKLQNIEIRKEKVFKVRLMKRSKQIYNWKQRKKIMKVNTNKFSTSF